MHVPKEARETDPPLSLKSGLLVVAIRDGHDVARLAPAEVEDFAGWKEGDDWAGLAATDLGGLAEVEHAEDFELIF